MPPRQKLVVAIRKEFIPKWIKVAYKIPIWLDKNFSHISVETVPRFEAEVTKHMKAFIENQKMPPKEIAGVIMNLADDYMAGRDMILRTGDYIAMQTYLQK